MKLSTILAQVLARVLDIVDDPLVPLEDRVGLVEERMIDELRDESPVRSVVLMRAVAVHRPDADRLRAEHLGRVHAHQLAGPLRDGVIVHLVGVFDGIVHHHVLGHYAFVVPVDLGTGEEDHPELQLLLQPEHVLCADHVGLPEVLVVVLAIPAAVLCGQVVDIIELLLFEYPFKLPVIPDISSECSCPDQCCRDPGQSLHGHGSSAH